MKPKTVWLPQKVHLLKKLYPKKTQKQIAKILKVSLYAVKGQVTVLRLRKRNRGWTKKDEQYLVTHYTAYSKADLARKFGKCRSAIIRKYNQLKK